MSPFEGGKWNLFSKAPVHTQDRLNAIVDKIPKDLSPEFGHMRMQLYLLGNKADLTPARRKELELEVEDFRKILTSTLGGEEIDVLFRGLGYDVDHE